MRITLVLIFLIVGVYTICSATQPSPQDQSKPNIGQKSGISHEKSNPTKTSQLGTEAAPLVVKIQIPTTSHQKTKENEEKDGYYWSSEWWLVYFTFALVVVTFILAIFTAKLWHSTKTMAQDAKDTAKRQAEEMLNSLRIAKDSADAAMEQAKTSTEALKRSNRAWVGVTGIVSVTTPLFADDEAKSINCCIRLSIRNIGTSPALKTTGFFELMVSQDSHIECLTFVGDKLEQDDNIGVTILPGQTLDWPNTNLNGATLLCGKVYVWLKGYFRYKDQFGDFHYSSFLFSYENTNGTREIHMNGKIPGEFVPFGVGWENT